MLLGGSHRQQAQRPAFRNEASNRWRREVLQSNGCHSIGISRNARLMSIPLASR